MTVYAAFNEYEALNNLSGISASTVTDISGVARAGFRALQSSANADLSLDTALTEGWFHCYFKPIDGAFASNNSNDMIGFDDGAGNQLFAIRWNQSSLNVSIVTANSGETTGIMSAGSVYDVDINWNISDSTDGFILVYVNEVLVYEEYGVTNAATSELTVSDIRFSGVTKTGGSGDGLYAHFGQVVVADETTIGAKVYTLTPSAGTTNDWDTGSVTDVDETGVNDSDQITTTTNGDTFTYDTSVTLSAPDAGKYWAAVTSTFRAAYDSSSAVTKLSPLLNDTTATNTYYGTSTTLSTGLSGYYYTWNQDPGTTADWTTSGINDYEFGLRADT